MNSDLILLGHGSGGRLSHQLLNELIIPALSGVRHGGTRGVEMLSGEQLPRIC